MKILALLAALALAMALGACATPHAATAGQTAAAAISGPGA
jgi:hypothetical protein